MASSIHLSVDDKDLDDAELWAVIDSAAALHSSKSRKTLALRHTTSLQTHTPDLNPFQTPKLSKTSRKQFSVDEDGSVPADGEVLHEHWIQNRPLKIARSSCGPRSGEGNRMVVYNRHLPRTPTATTPYYMSPDPGRFSVQEISPVSDVSPVDFRWNSDKGNLSPGLSARISSVPLFKEYQKVAMEILEKSDYIMISGNPYIKKSGWRKLSCYFNISFEIKDKSIEFDESRNVQRAEFMVRAYMQGGRFSDGWGSCDRREKRFQKPNHDVPSTAETRAKNKACQDLLGIGEFRPGTTSAHR